VNGFLRGNISEGSLPDIQENKTILVVEDESGIRETITELLSGIVGAPVVAKASADDALTFLATNSRQVSLVLLDDQMPGSLTGFQALPIIHELYPKIRIVMMGALLSQRPDSAYFDAGAVAMILKPWDIHKFADLVRQFYIARG